MVKGQGWFQFKGEYKQYFKVNFDGDYFPTHNSKDKSHFKFIELDM